jgi:hypothetical protein
LHDTRRAAGLDLLAVDARGGRTDDALARLVAALVVDVLDVVGVDVAGEVAARARLVFSREKRGGEERKGKERQGKGIGGNAPQYGQQDVNEQVGAAAGDEEDAHGGNCVVLVAGWRSGVSRAGARKRVTMMRRIVLSMVAVVVVVVVDVDVDVDVDVVDDV